MAKGKVANAKKPTLKKPAKITKRTKENDKPQFSPVKFRDVFLPCCTQGFCLPYLPSGGRRSDLALHSKEWVQLAVANKEVLAFTATQAKHGFLAIHATKKATDEAWDVTDGKAESWAEQMGQKLALLMRRVDQAQLQSPVPT